MSTQAYRIVSDVDPTAPRRAPGTQRATEAQRYQAFVTAAWQAMERERPYRAPWGARARGGPLWRWSRQGTVSETRTRSLLFGLLEVVTHPRPRWRAVEWFVIPASPLLGRPAMRIPLYPA